MKPTTILFFNHLNIEQIEGLTQNIGLGLVLEDGQIKGLELERSDFNESNS